MRFIFKKMQGSGGRANDIRELGGKKKRQAQIEKTIRESVSSR